MRLTNASGVSCATAELALIKAPATITSATHFLNKFILFDRFEDTKWCPHLTNPNAITVDEAKWMTTMKQDSIFHQVMK